MAMETDRTLRFGLNPVPDEARAAWGARLIWPNDLLWDRQGEVGEAEDVDRLSAWLNKGRALEKALAKAQMMARAREWASGDRHTVTLYEDDKGVIRGNPLGSYGYVYIIAFLKEDIATADKNAAR